MYNESKGDESFTFFKINSGGKNELNILILCDAPIGGRITNFSFLLSKLLVDFYTL